MPRTHRNRIAFVAANPTFVRLFLGDVIKLLVSQGKAVLVICGSDSQDDSLASDLGCAVKSLPFERTITPADDLRNLFSICRTLRAWRPALLHTHSPKAGLLGSLAGWLTRVPLRIHTFHGLRSETLKGSKRTLVRSMERLTAACSTHCLAISTSLRAELSRHGLCPASKSRVLGSGSCAGVDLDHLKPGVASQLGTQFRADHGISNDAPVITYIGRIAEDKGIVTLESSWQMLRADHPGLRLLIAGPVDTSDPCDTSTIDRLRSDPRVILLDHFISDVAPLLAASTIFVQPSRREGLGMSALEASAMEIPVVAARVTGLVDAVDHCHTGLLVKSNSAEALSEALDQMLRLPRLRLYMGQQGRRFVERHFNRRHVVARLDEYYAQRLLGLSPLPQRTKRAFDLVATLLLAIVALPVGLVIMASITLFMGAPAFFRQQRAGRDGIPFELMKFRTMRAPHPGEQQFTTDAVRTTPLGQLLRRTSLDELPQLWNVLRGDMSLVGPRPLLVDYLTRYSAQERRRHEVLPGITGWAQINGRNNLDWHERFRNDVWYVDHQSIVLDLRILLATVFQCFRPRGIVPQGKDSMSEFQGAQPASIAK